MEAAFFIEKPVAIRRKQVVTHDDKSTTVFQLYRSGRLLLKWSGEKAPPAIGQEVKITMNGIGPAIVKGYFAEAGYLGVMTLATNPPEWLRLQRGPNRDQLVAIHAWAKLHGRTWKDKLRTAWCRGNYGGFADAHFLQQVRNQFGPKWLDNYTHTPNPKELDQPAWALDGIGCEFGVEIEY